jgi:hypothetical protein
MDEPFFVFYRPRVSGVRQYLVDMDINEMYTELFD